MLFIENKYTQWYYRIIDQAQAQAQAADVYYEKHHIIPRSLGGSNQQDNLVRLTARAHYVVHRLLTRMTTGTDRHKMCTAIFLMTNTRKGVRISSHTYQVIREQAAKASSVQNKGKPSPLRGTKWDKPSPLKGKSSPIKGRKETKPRKPYKPRGKPSPLRGTKHDKPSPRKGIKETQPRKPYKPRSAEHTAKIQAAKLQKKLDRPLD